MNNSVKRITLEREDQNMHVIVHYHVSGQCVTLIFKMP